MVGVFALRAKYAGPSSQPGKVRPEPRLFALDIGHWRGFWRIRWTLRRRRRVQFHRPV